MNVQYLDFCVRAEGSNFAIWSSKWTPCDINVEIKKKKTFAQTRFRVISHFTLDLFLEPTATPTLPSLCGIPF